MMMNIHLMLMSEDDESSVDVDKNEGDVSSFIIISSSVDVDKNEGDVSSSIIISSSDAIVKMFRFV